MFYGSLAIFWWLVVAYHALRTCNRDEIYNCVALFLWLFANFWYVVYFLPSPPPFLPLLCFALIVSIISLIIIINYHSHSHPHLLSLPPSLPSPSSPSRWMTGEAHDYAYPDSPELSDIHTAQCARILETALLWLAVYYLVILPFDLMPVKPEAVAEYDDGSLKPRFSYFKNFRQYENSHMLFWLV